MTYQKREQYDIYFHIFQKPLQKNLELMVLAKRIDWDYITDRFLLYYYSRKGRQAKKIRLMTGLHILKHRFNLSDEDVVKGLHENIFISTTSDPIYLAYFTPNGFSPFLYRGKATSNQ